MIINSNTQLQTGVTTKTSGDHSITISVKPKRKRLKGKLVYKHTIK